MFVGRTVFNVSSLAAALGISLLLSGFASGHARADDGASAFAKNCGECHGSRAIQAWVRRQPDDNKRKAWLETFLAKHYPPPKEARSLIIDHIAAQKR